MSARGNILLALSDLEEAAGFSERLVDKGLDVTTAADGGAAIETALKDHPALVITDIDLPVMDGTRVFSILRANRQTAHIPFVFISDVVTELKGFRGGIDTFLLRPFNPDEVFGRISQVLLLKGGSRGEGREIQGKLSQMSLPDIIQFLLLNKKEGELCLVSGTLSGTIYIKDGEVLNAVLDGVEKEKAFFRLLDWDEGDFEFTPMAVQAARKVRGSTSNLLFEGMRQLDEMRAGLRPAPEGRVTPVDGAAPLKRGLPAVFYEVEKLLKLYSRVADIVDHSTFPDYEVYKTLGAMISKGIVAEEEPGPADAGGFLTLAEALAVRERITGRFADIRNYARVMVLASSGGLVDEFISGCARIPGFSLDTRTIFTQSPPGGRFGEVARLRLAGGLDLVIFSLPTARNMGPVIRAFSTNLAGLIVLSGRGPDGSAEPAPELVTEKEALLSFATVPAVHVLVGPGAGDGGTGGEGVAALRKAFGLSGSAPVVCLGPGEKDPAGMVFTELFRLIKNT